MKDLLIHNMIVELGKFKRACPAATPDNLKIWLIGYQAAITLLDDQSALMLEESIQMAKIG